MVTVHRQHGLRFAIYTDDHEPAHVHVLGDGEMKVVICGAAGLPEMVYKTGFKASDRRRAMEVVRERQDEFLVRWDEIQGRRRK
jgi:histidinol phosphatase-like PHP family hydrolase